MITTCIQWHTLEEKIPEIDEKAVLAMGGVEHDSTKYKVYVGRFKGFTGGDRSHTAWDLHECRRCVYPDTKLKILYWTQAIDHPCRPPSDNDIRVDRIVAKL